MRKTHCDTNAKWSATTQCEVHSILVSFVAAERRISYYLSFTHRFSFLFSSNIVYVALRPAATQFLNNPKIPKVRVRFPIRGSEPPSKSSKTKSSSPKEGGPGWISKKAPAKKAPKKKQTTTKSSKKKTKAPSTKKSKKATITKKATGTRKKSTVSDSPEVITMLDDSDDDGSFQEFASRAIPSKRRSALLDDLESDSESEFE